MGQLVHSSNNKYGENLLLHYRDVTGEEVVKAWYEEIDQYNFRAAKFNWNSGHFTQVVWKNSKELGVGIAKR